MRTDEGVAEFAQCQSHQPLYQWSIDAVNVKVIERNLDISWPGYANTVIHRR